MSSPIAVAFNRQDRFLLTLGNRVVVITQDGAVFGHDVAANALGGPFKFAGAKVAFNGPRDRFVVSMGSRILVVTEDGTVFGHDVNGNTIEPAFKFEGAKVAFNGPNDRFVVTMGNRLVVVTVDGSVFGHDITGNSIGGGFRFEGSKVAFNGSHDRFVATLGNRIIVTTFFGDVFAHEVAANTVLGGAALTSPPPPPRALQFRLRFFREHEATDSGIQGPSDEVFISAVGLDSNAVRQGADGRPEPQPVTAPSVGDASDDPVRNAWRNNPHVLMSFDPRRLGDFPRSYSVTLLLVEHDNEDMARDFAELQKAVGKEMKDAAVKAASAGAQKGVEAIAGGPIPGVGALVGAGVGALAGVAFDALMDAIQGGLSNEAFKPIPVVIEVDSPFAYKGHPEVGRERSIRVKEHGAEYDILYDWHVVD